LALATANSQTNTVDPTVGALLQSIRDTTSRGSVNATTDPNLQRFTFITKGGQLRKFTTLRFDANLNSRNTVEASWNYQHLYYTGDKVDFFNNSDPQFPGFPNRASIPSYRFDGVVAWRSTITPRMVNELRAGLQGGTILFYPEVTPTQFANQGGFDLGGTNPQGINVAGITSATSVNGPSRRNVPVKNIYDTLNIARNAHNLALGFSFTQINIWSVNQTVVPTIGIGVDATDPASAMFNTTNFP